MMDLFEQLKQLLAEIESAAPAGPEELEQFRIRFLGSKNILKPLMGGIKDVPADRKKEFGQLINAVKTAAEEKYQALSEGSSAKRDSGPDAGLDPTAPPEPYDLGSRHPVSLTMDRIVQVFLRMGFVVAEDREIEDDWHNFSAMNTPEDHPARDMQDTFYVVDPKGLLLRTHTSSVQARVMSRQKPPIRMISPGRVYRNETISARSHCQFHQVEGLYVDKGVSFADLKETIYQFARDMFGPDARIRMRASYFPFTEPSAEVDVYWGLRDEIDHRITKGTGWLEIMGCGMVDPVVLSNCGIDPETYTGFAFGMGIERMALLLHRISDIRLFFENDTRFLKQFESIL